MIGILKRKFGKEMEKYNIQVEQVDVGQHKNRSEVDKEKLSRAVKHYNPTRIVLAWCWSRLSEVNDVFAAAGIYPEMIVRQDLSIITEGRRITLDQQQKEIIREISEKQPKNVLLWGLAGSGKTLLLT